MPKTNLTFIARELSTRLVQLQGYGPTDAPRTLTLAIQALRSCLWLLRRIEALEEQGQTTIRGPILPS